MRTTIDNLEIIEAGRSEKPVSEVVIRHSLSSQEKEEWDRFVLSSPTADFFHYSGWQEIVKSVLGHKPFYLFARDAQGITGVFPISWVRTKIFGNCLVSSPLAVYSGICARDERTYFDLLAAATGLARQLNVEYLEMRNRAEPFATRLPGRDLYVTFTQNLLPGPEKLLGALPRDTRYAVRKAQKAGLEWTEDVSVEQFYEIYARSLHKLGTPVFPKALFANLTSEFRENTRIFGVRKGSAVIASVLCFYFRDQVLPYYAGALPEFYKDSPNNFMYWNLISQSCREGLRYFDFGRSKRGTGSYQFKSAWSMQVSELPYRYQLIRAKAVPEMSPIDKRFHLPVSIWKQLPFSWTKMLGPRLLPLIPSV